MININQMGQKINCTRLVSLMSTDIIWNIQSIHLCSYHLFELKCDHFLLSSYLPSYLPLFKSFISSPWKTFTGYSACTDLVLPDPPTPYHATIFNSYNAINSCKNANTNNSTNEVYKMPLMWCDVRKDDVNLLNSLSKQMWRSYKHIKRYKFKCSRFRKTSLGLL